MSVVFTPEADDDRPVAARRPRHSRSNGPLRLQRFAQPVPGLFCGLRVPRSFFRSGLQDSSSSHRRIARISRATKKILEPILHLLYSE
ncbi:hypothetical protein GN956_G5947 [Arapaima gigas]